MSGHRHRLHRRAGLPLAGSIALGLMAVSAAPADPSVAGTTAAATRTIAPSIVVMSFPEPLGPMERERVEFDHAAHTRELEGRGCETCHPIREGIFGPGLSAVAGLDDRDSMLNAYHDACTGCHRERSDAGASAGPVTCGECHARRSPARSARAAMRFDYSLHGRHAQAYPEKCETCHHVFDEAQQKLVYLEGAEEACRGCHGDRELDKRPALRAAAHISCVGCHLRRIGDKLEGGPVLCVGCHDPEQLEGIERLDPVPRLLRGQKDALWVHTDGTKEQLVGFDHLGHERRTSSCSDCHHERLKPCGECHTLAGAAAGGGVILEQSQHSVEATYGCVGCHASETRTAACAGCHEPLPRPPAERSCTRCHRGPRVLASEQVENLPPPEPVSVELPPLPPSSDDFPETIEIGRLTDRYQAAKLPHRKIVEKLDASTRESSLARSFHGSTDVLCAGCHHHSPTGGRPPDCRSCHGDTAHATLDKPGLMVAYHRQCMGCHQRMGIGKLGCTDCHAEREEQP